MKVDSNSYHYYLIGYIYSNYLQLYYYKYIPNVENIQVASKENINDKINGQQKALLNKGISCELLKNNNEDIITCFYAFNYGSGYCLSVAFFNIDNSNNIISKKDPIHLIPYGKYTLGYIKSYPTPDHSKILYCYYFTVWVWYIIWYK